MPDIPQIDLAWEAVHLLGELSRKALEEIERLGGKNPGPQRAPDSATGMLVELTNYGYDSIASMVSKAAGNALPPVTMNFSVLIGAYKQEERYRKLQYKTRLSYDYHMARIEREIGGLPLKNITLRDIQSWYQRWSSHGKRVAMGHAVLNYVRMLVGVGAAKFADQDCIRLSVALRLTHFKKPGSSWKRINSDQLIVFRKRAHKKEWHSLALAVALQFEAELGQKIVIGEWIPLSEPGESDVTTTKGKWVGGLDWSQIDADRILRLIMGGKEIEIDLNRLPMVRDELNLLTEIPESGPMIVSGKLPYEASEFRRRWRIVANEVGIPKNVFNTHHQGQEREPSDRTRRREILEKVTDLCRPVQNDIRNDVRQQMILDVLEGKITVKQLPAARSQYIRDHYKNNGGGFATLSLDQPIAGSDRVRLIDTIRSDHEIWKGT